MYRSPFVIVCLLFGAALAGGSGADDPSGRWWAPGADRLLPQSLSYADDTGAITILNLSGLTKTSGHPFFTPMGPNGRACVTCHQPADGMRLALTPLQARWQANAGKDPLFAAIDGSNCPSL